MGTKLGNEGKVYYGSAGGTSGSNLIPKIQDFDLQLKAAAVDQTSRADAGWKNQRSGLKEWSCSFTMVHDTDDAALTALRTFFFAGSTFGVTILDSANGEGVSGAASITNFSKGEPLNGVQTWNVELVGTGAATAV